MSVLTLQIGQCGNQIGQAVFDHVYEDIKTTKTLSPKPANLDYCSRAQDIWFHTNAREQLIARAVLVDTETKVVSESGYTGKQKKGYSFKSICVKTLGGSANNWAFGYSTNGDSLSNTVLERVRKQLELSDSTSVLLSFLSSSGGTGSGVGCKILEKLRDEYPAKTLVNCVTLPYKSGEVVTQSYNTLLSLSKLYDVSDALIVFENDKLHQICKNSESNRDVSFEDLNTIVAHQITSLIQPANCLNLSTIVQDLTHPCHRFLQLKSAPSLVRKEHLTFESDITWTPILREIVKPLSTDFILSATKPIRPKSLGTVLITRGGKSPTLDQLKPLREGLIYADWVTESNRVQHYHQARHFHDLNRYATAVSNNNGICNSLNGIVEKAWQLFTHGVYLHHYKSHGVDDQYFLEGFQKVENVIHSYKTL